MFQGVLNKYPLKNICQLTSQYLYSPRAGSSYFHLQQWSNLYGAKRWVSTTWLVASIVTPCSTGEPKYLFLCMCPSITDIKVMARSAATDRGCYRALKWTARWRGVSQDGLLLLDSCSRWSGSLGLPPASQSVSFNLLFWRCHKSYQLNYVLLGIYLIFLYFII